ncbi:LuxR C-terminal-related transcriptional regulator [Microbacterium sp. 22296]
MRKAASRRTVDFHVGNIVRRLGLGHRREITRVLRP